MYKDEIVVFIDVLGFKNFAADGSFDKVESLYKKLTKSTNDAESSYRQVLSNLKNALKVSAEKGDFKLKPEKTRVRFFSDCLIMVLDIDEIPQNLYWAMLDRVIMTVHQIFLAMAHHGMLIRGGVSYGPIFMTEASVHGNGLVRAYELEQIAHYPRIVLDPKLIEDHKPDNFTKHCLRHLSKSGDGKFYAIDSFKIIQQMHDSSVEINKDKSNDSQPVNFSKLFAEPLVKIIPKGINHNNLGVVEKYKWLRNGLLSLELTDYDLSVLNEKEYRNRFRFSPIAWWKFCKVKLIKILSR
jgi:hypothetical protein